MSSTSSKYDSPQTSIIIPVFNAERHLEEALDSATRQTLRNIEIICVDDGSSDNSPLILESASRADSRIRVIHHDKNRGEGAARNTGLDLAQGEYIFHLDADDSIPPEAIGLLYENAQSNSSDMVKGAYLRFENTHEISNPAWVSPRLKFHNLSILSSRILQNIPSVHCSYLYRRDFLERNQLRYPEDLKVGLDLVALTQALVAAKRVNAIPDIVYHYRQDQQSTTQGGLNEDQLVDDVLAKGLVASILTAADLNQAGQEFLQNWRWQIREYWIDMACNQGYAVCHRVFDEVRICLKQLTPWKQDSPLAHRYLLSLIVNGEDEQAIDFLQKKVVDHEYGDLDKERAAWLKVLAIKPEDWNSHYRLGLLETKDQQFSCAIEQLQQAATLAPSSLLPRLELASLAQKQGDMEVARNYLLEAQQLLEEQTDLDYYVKKLVSQYNRLATDQKQEMVKSLRSTVVELKQTNNEINLIDGELTRLQQSLFWRISSPLRHARRLFLRLRK